MLNRPPNPNALDGTMRQKLAFQITAARSLRTSRVARGSSCCRLSLVVSGRDRAAGFSGCGTGGGPVRGRTMMVICTWVIRWESLSAHEIHSCASDRTAIGMLLIRGIQTYRSTMSEPFNPWIELHKQLKRASGYSSPSRQRTTTRMCSRTRSSSMRCARTRRVTSGPVSTSASAHRWPVWKSSASSPNLFVAWTLSRSPGRSRGATARR